MALAVNQTFGNNSTSGVGADINSSTVTTVSGSLLVVILHSYNTAGVGANGDITDSKSNTYTHHGGFYNGVNGAGIAIYSNDAGTRGSGHFISGNRVNDGASQCNIACIEITGHNTGAAFDATTFAAIADASGNTPWLVTAAAAISGNQIAVGGVTIDTGGTNAWTDPTGYTNINHQDNGSGALVTCASYKLNETGTPVVSWANNDTTSTGLSAVLIATFKEAGGGPPAPTPITFQQAGGNSAGGTTSLTIPYPVTGLATGDLFLVGRTVKPESATVTTPPSPFTALANTTGGTGVTGVDTGLTRLSTEYLISPSGSETGNLTTAQGNSPNSALGQMVRFRKSPGTHWVAPAVVTADDSSHGTSRSAAAGSAMEVLPGDMLVAFFSSDTDTATAYTAAAFTGTGLTTATATIDQGAGGVTTGNDSGIYITHALVTAATGSTTVTATLTTGPSSCGATHIIRLRCVYPVHYGREPRLTRVGSIVPIVSRMRR
jgi:hypothetical protein